MNDSQNSEVSQENSENGMDERAPCGIDMRKVRVSPAGALLRLASIFLEIGSPVIRANDEEQIQVSEDYWVSVVGLVERSFDRQFGVFRNRLSYQRKYVSRVRDKSTVPRIRFGENVHQVLDPRTLFGRECIRAASRAQCTVVDKNAIDVTNLYGPRLDIAAALARLWVATNRIECLSKMRWDGSSTEDGRQHLQQIQMESSMALGGALQDALQNAEESQSPISPSIASKQVIEELEDEILVVCQNIHNISGNPPTPITFASSESADRIIPESGAMLDALGMQVVILEVQLDELRNYTVDLNLISSMEILGNSHGVHHRKSQNGLNFLVTSNVILPSLI